MPTTDDTPTAAGATNVLLNQRALTAPYHREAVGIQGDENIGKAIGFDASGTLGAIEVGGGGGTYVGTIADMRALTDLSPGQVIYVGPRLDQFLVVDDDSLGTDGGTVFIPNSELSAAVYEEAIPPTYFNDAYAATIAKEYDLAHTGIDFESVELVLTDGGETVDIWLLHGHVMNPVVVERTATPQLPHIDTGRGKFRDPLGYMTAGFSAPHQPIRTGGALLRYKYATSGLRLKRVVGPVFDLRWWSVVAVDDEEPGEETDNSGRICWCANAAAKAGAEAVLIPKMYYYKRLVEWPNGVEMRGYGPGISGFKAMTNSFFRELLLSTSSDGAGADQTLNPVNKPATRLWSYDGGLYGHCPSFFPATGSSRTRISGIEFNGNIENNMRIFTERENEYAWKYANSSIHLFNVPCAAAFAVTNHGQRVIPEGHRLELHNVKMHGYSTMLLGNHNSTTISTGMLELGNCIVGHWSYLSDGVFETVRCFGYTMGDGLRCRKFIAKSVEMILAPHPEIMFFLATLPADERSYMMRGMLLITANEFPQAGNANLPFPELSNQRINIDHLFIDATGLDNWPQAYNYQLPCPFFIGADDIQIRSGKIRYGTLPTSVANFVWTHTAVSNYGGAFRNQAFENLHIEFGSRKGFELFACGVTDGGPSQLLFRNITIEPRAVSHNVNDPSPDAVSIILGEYRFKEYIPPEPYSDGWIYDGRNYEFSAITPDATLNGKYIDITPPDTGAPTFRFWFNYNAAGVAPSGTGVTLVPVPVSAGATTAAVAAAFSAAISGTIAAPAVPTPYLTSATYGTKSTVGSFSNYRGGPKGGYVATNITNAAGVTTVLGSHRRHYEPSFVNFERVIANDPTAMYLLDIRGIDPSREVYFKFDGCILGAQHLSRISMNANGAFTPGGADAADLAKDRIHCAFIDTIFDIRDAVSFYGVHMDLTLYCSSFRNCRVRTPRVDTGLTLMGAGYELLFSEQSGVHTVTPTAGATFVEIQTKLFWVPKDGQTRIHPVDAATAAVWNTNLPAMEWRRSTRPVTGASAIALGGTGAYYQGPDSVNEDRRAPVLRLNFATPLAATQLKIGWAAAVSP